MIRCKNYNKIVMFVLLCFLSNILFFKVSALCKNELNLSHFSKNEVLKNVDKSKKLLILYCSMGGGHQACTTAIYEWYKKYHSEFNVEMHNLMGESSPFWDKKITRLYDFIVNNFLNFYANLYKMGNFSVPCALVKKFERRLCSVLRDIVKSTNPSLIISTHPFSTEAMGELKKSCLKNIPTISVVTDYNAHRVWAHKNVDAHVTPLSDSVNDLRSFGVKKDKIFPIGIPIREEFLIDMDKTEIYAKNELSHDKKTVLMMGGMYGFGDMGNIFESLIAKNDEDVQVIAVCGKNESLFCQLKKIEKKFPYKKTKTKVVGFTDKVFEFMKIADVFVTKPGGLSITESLSNGVPCLIFYAIPGQEERNAKFLVKNNLGIMLKDGDKSKQILDFIKDENKLILFKENCRKFSNKHCLEDFNDIVVSQIIN